WPRKERSAEGSALRAGPSLCARTPAEPVSALKTPEAAEPGAAVDKTEACGLGSLLAAGGCYWLVAQLLRPPVGLALVHLLLQLPDVLGEVALLLAQAQLQLADRLLAVLELRLADLGVAPGPGPAPLVLGLALVQLALAVGDRLLGLAEPLLAPLDAG